MCGTSNTSSNKNNRRYIPSIITNFIKNGHIFCSFLLDFFSAKQKLDHV